MFRLQILVSTIGVEGINRLAISILPRIEGVEWLVCWQNPSSNLPNSLQRDDIKICLCNEKGLSKSRNMLIDIATAEICLLADDDMDYTVEQISSLIKLHESLSGTDLIMTRALIPGSLKKYPNKATQLKSLPRGWWASSVEMSFKLKAIREKKLKFDTRFGLGSGLIESGEDEIFLYHATRKGLTCQYYPLICGSHRGFPSSSSKKISVSQKIAKGAIFKQIYPYSWWLRLLRHGLSTFKYGVKGIRIVKQFQSESL